MVVIIDCYYQVNSNVLHLLFYQCYYLKTQHETEQNVLLFNVKLYDVHVCSILVSQRLTSFINLLGVIMMGCLVDCLFICLFVCLLFT